MDTWDPIPWHRQPCDATEARWCAWLLYLELPRPRDLRALARGAGVTHATAERWSRLGYWRERAAAWDAGVDQRALDERHEHVAEQRAALARARPIQDAHGDILRDARDLVATALGKHLALERDSEMPTVDLRDLTRLLSVALPAERLAHGAPTERLAVDVSGLSDDDLSTLERILTRAS